MSAVYPLVRLFGEITPFLALFSARILCLQPIVVPFFVGTKFLTTTVINPVLGIPKPPYFFSPWLFATKIEFLSVHVVLFKVRLFEWSLTLGLFGRILLFQSRPVSLFLAPLAR